MTPAARHQAAIDCVDRIVAGAAPEQVLTAWARGNRYAGSGDRAALRDIVYDIVRRWRSTAWDGGGESGRARVLGLLRQAGTDPDAIFDGSRYGPAVLSGAERALPGDAPEAVCLDCPDWLWSMAADELADPAAHFKALRHRAPVTLRVNVAKATTDEVARELAVDGIETEAVEGVATALSVTTGARRLARHPSYLDGRVELQDAAGQAAILALPSLANARVLDLCAGGGGKSLALAAQGAEVIATDIDPGRMGDLPQRAARAGARIATRPIDAPGSGFDGLVLDVPCSGAGTWRRAPQGKWALTPEGLAALAPVQDGLIDRAATLVRPGGWIAYMTCSVLARENDARVEAALTRHADLQETLRKTWRIGAPGDGFFLSILRKAGVG